MDARTAIAAFCLAAGVAAQEPGPRFEVVSIRGVPRDAPPIMREIDFSPVRPGGQYIDSRTSLVSMISFGYNIRFPDIQLSGLPNWAKSQAYAVAAKPAEGFPLLPPAENREQVRLMMRALLAERFHLRLRPETRQEQVYQLEIAKGGIKAKEVEAPVPPAKETPVGASMSNSFGRMIGKQSTMAGIASAVTIFLRRPVIDRTGLKGFYDFDVKWAAPEPFDGQPPSSGFGAEGEALLISALQKDLGLRLTKAAGPVEYWVVEHVEPPTEN